MITATNKKGPVVVDREIGGEKVSFNFKPSTSEAATKALDAALETNANADAIRADLAKYIVKDKPVPSKISAVKAGAKAKAEKEPGKGRGDSNELRTKVLALFDKMHGEKAGQEDMIKAAMKLKNNAGEEMSYANAYYYFGRVWNVGHKKMPKQPKKPPVAKAKK